MNKMEIIEKIHSILEGTNGGYLARLKTIHKHYPNVKSELRYRDALLEEFNDLFLQEGLRAYAEVDKMDLVIVTKPLTTLNIQLKYHYAYDLNTTVFKNRPIDIQTIIKDISTKKNIGNKSRTVAESIVEDCINKNECDFFILIIQDRSGHKKEKEKLPGGIVNKFIGHQIRLDKMNETDRKWNENAIHFLEEICKFKKNEYVSESRDFKHPIANESDDNPLTSHFYILEFSKIDD
jgi:hypothetical protein